MSIIFYGWGEYELVILILLSSVVDFTSGLIIEYGKRKLGLTLSIIFNIGILAYFKYADFAYTNFITLMSHFNVSIENATRFSDVVLPLGISFYTFQTMSYTIDVYRGQVKASKNFINFATYVTLFPQLVAGPIVRYKDIESELKNRTINTSNFSDGAQRFIIGLAKKMLIANNCGFLADGIFNIPSSDLSASLAWLGVIAYSFQIYFDFSGYSDMAIGIGKMLGFSFPENFNFPYISKSIREFWRRWHITLSYWFRDYLYISLGGNRKNEIRTYFNLFIVFVITGLWHGANWTFIIWGLIHGLFIIIERLGFDNILQRAPKFFSHFYLLFIVTISWVFFRSDNISEAVIYLSNMFDFTTETNLGILHFYCPNETIIALILAMFFSTPIHKKLKVATLNLFKNKHALYITSKYIGILVLFIICCMYISVDSYNPFIYFRF